MQVQVITYRPITIILSSFMLMLGVLLATQVQAGTLAENQAQLDRLYETMLSDPTNVDVTLEYAELAVEVGDYEAAIPPLERLLISNPGANKLKLELGIMYYLLGSYDVAHSYFGEITIDPKASADHIRQAESYLKRL